MNDTHHKTRWVLSPMVKRSDGSEYPVAEDYSTTIYAPFIYNGAALCRCTLNAHQMEAAVKDDRLVVCPSLHDRAKVNPRIAEHHAEHGLRPDMLLHEALEKLGELHHAFLPDF